jgi:hypothetical protein
MKRMLLSATAITALLVTSGAVAQTSGQDGELLPQQGQGSSGGAAQGGATVQPNEVPQTGTMTQDTGAAAGAAEQAGGAAQEEAAGQAGAGGTEAAGEAQTGTTTQDTTQDTGAAEQPEGAAQDQPEGAAQDEAAGQTGAETEQAQPEGVAQEEAQSGQAGQDAAKAPKVEVTQEQRTVVRQTIVEQSVEPVDVDFEVNIGATIPQTVVLHPLPPRIIEIVPVFAGYSFFILADGTIVIVDPGAWRIVYIISA